MYKILITDDDFDIREALSDYLTAKGFSVVTAKNGAEAVDFAMKEPFDLILLDVLMPIMDGLKACKEIREFSDVPVIFLSALGQEENLLQGYKYGADDYIVKPFPLSVLCEKISTTIRRNKGLKQDDSIEASGVRLDFKKRTVCVDEEEKRLPLKDFNLLCLLVQNKGTVLSRDIIISKIWGWDFDGDNRTVDTHIKRIRKALGKKAYLITTTSGIGYSFKKEE
ncbi:MAG: response regulator transcription factor [Clostridia bacterium]|nr:response regulator transcription factor [Clostridia bacterium]